MLKSGKQAVYFERDDYYGKYHIFNQNFDSESRTWTGSFHYLSDDPTYTKYRKANLTIIFDENFNTNVKGSFIYTDKDNKTTTENIPTGSLKNKENEWVIQGGIKTSSLVHSGPIKGEGKHKSGFYQCD